MDNYPPAPPPVPPPMPPPVPKKEEGIGKYALIAGGGCLLLLLFAGAIGFFVYYIFQKTGDPLKVVNQQLAAIRENDLEKAYSYCSDGFKKITNYQNFQSFVQSNAAIKDSREFTSYNRSIEQGVAKLKGNLVTMTGSTTPAEYHLVKEGPSWKVQYIDLGAAGTAQDQRPSEPARDTPGTEYQGRPGEPAKEKGILEGIFDREGSGDLRISDVSVEKSDQGNLASITIRFKVYGFQTETGSNPRMHLIQDLQTYGPDGNLLPELSKEGIKELEDFGTFTYADLWNSLTIPSSYPRGRYECRLTVHDKISGRDTTSSAEFEL
jgi:hypothetical protein